ncbi:MAG: hypothetical protein Q8O92_06525 [Candidatus Latescibacter sp.]|nr:hypothetical protein [Candidatus Latescibacter sp.]
MVEYLEPVSMKFILVSAAVAAVVAIADVVLLVRRRGTARLEGLLPAVDSILVIAGFMAFTGTCIALMQSAGKIAMSTIPREITLSKIAQRWQMTFSWKEWDFMFKVMLSAFLTAIIAWLLFFVFFEVWFLLRLLYRKNIKKLPASS